MSTLKDAVLNVLLSSDRVRGFINQKISRYAEIKQLEKNKNGYYARVRLQGMNDPSGEICVTVRDILIASDSSTVTLIDVHADQLWADNLLQDFAEGKVIDVPEEYRSIVAKAECIL